MKLTLRKIHKYLGLSLGIFWLLQALSGITLVYHRTIDDQLLGATGNPINLDVVDQTIQRLGQNKDSKIIQYFVSGGVEGQVDLLTVNQDGKRGILRIDGASGAILRSSSFDHTPSDLPLFRFLLLFHKELLAGEWGHWLIGVSGLILFTSIVLGLKIAWPQKNRWRDLLLPKTATTQAAKYYAWHRALGFWLAPFGLIMAFTGALMVWAPTPWYFFSPPQDSIQPLLPEEEVISSAQAVTAARSIFQDAQLAIVSLPESLHPWYIIRLRQSGELRRVFGTTQVYIDARNGKALSINDALSAPLKTKFIAALWPIHNGEWGSWLTQLITMATGLWLTIIIFLGFRLYWLRYRMRNRVKN